MRLSKRLLKYLWKDITIGLCVHDMIELTDKDTHDIGWSGMLRDSCKCENDRTTTIASRTS